MIGDKVIGQDGSEDAIRNATLKICCWRVDLCLFQVTCKIQIVFFFEIHFLVSKRTVCCLMLTGFYVATLTIVFLYSKPPPHHSKS